MGVYRERVYPRLIDVACNTSQARQARAEVCAALTGDVLEIGFGTGLNLPHLPPSVRRLLAVDPMRTGPRLAAARLGSTDVEVRFVGVDGQSLELDDHSVDTALCTWTLCSIPDPVAAVREIARVLRPGGTFHFVEHGRSPDAGVRRWQDRLNGVQRRVACGCNLNRDILRIVEEGGMTVDRIDTSYADGHPKVLGWTYRGVARVAATVPATDQPASPSGQLPLVSEFVERCSPNRCMSP